MTGAKAPHRTTPPNSNQIIDRNTRRLSQLARGFEGAFAATSFDIGNMDAALNFQVLKSSLPGHAERVE